MEVEISLVCKSVGACHFVQKCLEGSRMDADQATDAEGREFAAGDEPLDCARTGLKGLSHLLDGEQTLNDVARLGRGLAKGQSSASLLRPVSRPGMCSWASVAAWRASARTRIRNAGCAAARPLVVP